MIGKKKDFSTAGKQGREPVEAPFCDELLYCCVCGKIYFARYPIRIRTRGRKDYHACLACSDEMMCSICKRRVTPATSILVEDPESSIGGFMCSACWDKVFLNRRPGKSGERRRLAAWFPFGLIALFRRITGIKTRPRKKREQD